MRNPEDENQQVSVPDLRWKKGDGPWGSSSNELRNEGSVTETGVSGGKLLTSFYEGVGDWSTISFTKCGLRGGKKSHLENALVISFRARAQVRGEDLRYIFIFLGRLIKFTALPHLNYKPIKM